MQVGTSNIVSTSVEQGNALSVFKDVCCV